MDFPNFKTLATFGFAALGACGAVPGFDIPPQTPRVVIGNGGSLFGGSETRIYAGDVAVFSARAGGETAPRESLVVLRAGAFERLRGQALSLILDTRGQDASEPACLDYGLDVILVWDGRRVQDVVSASCPVEGLTHAQDTLRRALNLEIVP